MLLLDYVDRLSLSNYIFGDDVYIVWIFVERSFLRIVISQRWVAEDDDDDLITPEDIDAYFANLRFDKIFRSDDLKRIALKGSRYMTWSKELRTRGMCSVCSSLTVQPARSTVGAALRPLPGFGVNRDFFFLVVSQYPVSIDSYPIKHREHAGLSLGLMSLLFDGEPFGRG
jgi:hypothetical protein